MVEEEILKCHRSAYIGPSREVDVYYEYLKRHFPTKKWYRGGKTIFERRFGFMFTVWRESRMVRYFKLFVDSGIYNRVSNQVALNANILREREANLGKSEKFRYAEMSFKVVQLGDSIQTVFILLAICLGVSCCVVVFECGKYNRAAIAKRGALICARIIKTVQRCRKKTRPAV